MAVQLSRHVGFLGADGKVNHAAAFELEQWLLAVGGQIFRETVGLVPLDRRIGTLGAAGLSSIVATGRPFTNNTRLMLFRLFSE